MSTTSRVPAPSGALGTSPSDEPSAWWPRLEAQVPILVPTLLALSMTVWHYDTKPLWRDEVFTLTTAGRSLPEMFGLLLTRDAGLTGYYTLMHAWLLVSHDPAWMRLPGALAAVAAVALTAALGRRVGGNGVALLAGTILALSQALVVHAQEARPYPLVLATTTAVALLALRTADDPRRGRRTALGVTAALAVCLHPLVALPAVAGILGVLWLRPGRARRGEVTVVALPAAVLGVALVVVGSVQAAASPPAPMPLWRLTTFWELFAAEPLPGVVVGVLAVVGVVSLAGRHREAMVLAAWAFLPLAAVSTLGLLGGYFNSRYGTAAVPAIAVLAATGASVLVVAALARLRPGSRAGSRRLAVTAVALAVAVGLGPSAVADRQEAYAFDDAPAAAAQLAAQDRYGDAVVFVGAVARPLVERYLPPGELASGRLDDALLAPGNQHTDTLGGEDVPAGARRAALAARDRVWVVGTMAVATDDLSRRSSITRAAEAGRTMVSRTDHGHVRVELWSTGLGRTHG